MMEHWNNVPGHRKISWSRFRKEWVRVGLCMFAEKKNCTNDSHIPLTTHHSWLWQIKLLSCYPTSWSTMPLCTVQIPRLHRVVAGRDVAEWLNVKHSRKKQWISDPDPAQRYRWYRCARIQGGASDHQWHRFDQVWLGRCGRRPILVQKRGRRGQLPSHVREALDPLVHRDCLASLPRLDRKSVIFIDNAPYLCYPLLPTSTKRSSRAPKSPRATPWLQRWWDSEMKSWLISKGIPGVEWQ